MNWRRQYQMCFADSALLISISSGVRSHILVNTTDLDRPGQLQRLQLVSLNGITLSEYPLVGDVNEDNIYRTDAFKPPSGYFYIKVRTHLAYQYILKSVSRWVNTWLMMCVLGDRWGWPGSRVMEDHAHCYQPPETSSTHCVHAGDHTRFLPLHCYHCLCGGICDSLHSAVVQEWTAGRIWGSIPVS